jgi:hypothetical protein
VQNVGPLFDRPKRERIPKSGENEAKRDQGMQRRFEPVVIRTDGA